MRSFVLVMFLFFQSAFACSFGVSWVLVEEIPSWIDGTAENLISLKKQGILFDLHLDNENDLENFRSMENSSIYFEIPDLKIKVSFKINPFLSIEEQLIIHLIQESKWNSTYIGWNGANFIIGSYKIKLLEIINPLDVIYELLSDPIEKELKTENAIVRPSICGEYLYDIYYADRFAKYENKTDDLVISVTFTNKMIGIQFFEPNSISELYFASSFLYFDNKIEDYEFYKNQENPRIGVTFLFRITRNIGINQKIGSVYIPTDILSS